MGKTCSWCGFLWRAASGSHLLLSLFLSSQFVLLSFPFPFFFCGSSLSLRITLAFFGSGETKKKLSFELSQLKAQLASMEVELDSERQGCQDSKRVLYTQIIEAEQRRDEAMVALRDSSRKCEGLKECEGTPSSFCLFASLFL
jgi:hypothetical protein